MLGSGQSADTYINEATGNLNNRITDPFYQYEQVKTVYLMSGAYDIALIIEGKTLNEVALFVAEQLSPMDTVISTATH